MANMYDDLDDLIDAYEEGEIDLKEYISEYNRIVKKDSERQMDRDKFDERSS